MKLSRNIFQISVLAVAIALPMTAAQAQNNGTTSYRLADDWANLPEGREMGSVGKLTMALDGESIWAVIRCGRQPDEVVLKAPSTIPPLFGYECLDSDLDSVIQFDLDGNVIQSFGGGLFIWPHGIGIDGDGNIWVTDAVSTNRIPAGDTRGHKVIKFSPTGEVLLELGTGGVAGDGPDHLTSPSDVAFAANGDILVADGHNAGGNDRVIRFTLDGEFVSEFGETGYGQTQFRGIHAIATDEAGRIYVGDRGNSRIVILNEDYSYVTTWTQFGRPSGIYITGDTIYVADSESDNVQNPGYEMGIRIGEITTGWVSEFILYPWGNPNITLGTGAEFVTVDRQGNIYGGEPVPKHIQQYIRVRP